MKYTKFTNKILLALFISIFLISFISAEQQSLGTFNLNERINVIQICSNCSYVNISSILYPNSSQALGESGMTKLGTKYSLFYENTSTFGTYIVNGHGDIDGTDTVWSYTFFIAPQYQITTAVSLFYVGVLGVLCFLFVLSILFIGILPSQDPIGNDGNIMSINNLKYLKYPIAGLAWGILVIISFVIFNFAEGYINEALLVSTFRMIFQFLMISAMIGVPVIFFFMVTKFMQDQVIKRMIERNIFTD